MFVFSRCTHLRPLRGAAFWLCGALLVCATLLAGCQRSTPPAATAPSTATIQIVTPGDLAELQTLFRTHEYDWDRLEKGVPPLVLTRLPADLDGPLPSEERKRVFLLSLLPMVLLVNQAIEAERLEIQEILARHDHFGLLTEQDRQRLRALAESYRVNGDVLSDPEVRNDLLRRIDTLPPAMVLAQAATESGWGTSALARRSNNLFGQMSGTSAGSYEYRRYDSLFESIRGYMRNLNTYGAYTALREIREQMRSDESQPVSGIQLAGGLHAYSERNTAYIAYIRSVIRSNDLTRLNHSFLRVTDPSRTAFIPSLADFLSRPASAADYP